jgi:hypothetical protein
MRPPILDPTAGKRARAIRAHLAAVVRIPDPTDPRCGELMPDTPEHGGAHRNFDPTDPEYGEMSA